MSLPSRVAVTPSDDDQTDHNEIDEEVIAEGAHAERGTDQHGQVRLFPPQLRLKTPPHTSASLSAIQPFAIRVQQLVKQHPGTRFKAVDSLNLAIQHGECFGLLGVNGAGKTTTISILCGLYGSSGGTATICGLDVEHNMDDIRSVIGICPQVCSVSDSASNPPQIRLTPPPHTCVSLPPV